MMAGEGDVVAGWHNKLQAAIAHVAPADLLAEACTARWPNRRTEWEQLVGHKPDQLPISSPLARLFHLTY